MVADTALVDRLVVRQQTIHGAECAQVIDMLSFVADARNAAPRSGEKAGNLEAEAALHELSLALKIPVGTLQGALAGARFARAELPRVWEAWEDGLIGAAHVGAIVEKAHRLRRPASLQRLDDEVVPIATGRSVGQLRRWLARFVDRVEPDKAADRHREAKRERRVYVEVGEDGMSWLSALIPSTEAAAINTKIEQAARKAGADNTRTHDQRRADAFSDLILGDREGSGSSKVDIGVVVPIQSLVGLSDAPGELIDRSASVPASYIRSLAVREGTWGHLPRAKRVGGVWRLLTDERGNLLDVSRMGRFVAGDLGMAIRFRDGTSVFPTPVVPADDCDIDHSESYPAPTTASNLGALHRRAHRLKTDGALRVRQPEPGVFQWETSTGHTYTRTPDPLPTTGWDPCPWFDQGFLDATEQDIANGMYGAGRYGDDLAA